MDLSECGFVGRLEAGDDPIAEFLRVRNHVLGRPPRVLCVKCLGRAQAMPRHLLRAAPAGRRQGGSPVRRPAGGTGALEPAARWFVSFPTASCPQRALCPRVCGRGTWLQQPSSRRG